MLEEFCLDAESATSLECRMRNRPSGFNLFLTLVVIACQRLFAGEVLSQTPHFQNKTITILRGGKPGGSGDMQARALIPSLRKYIPANV
jgi:hypothetical protein